MDKDQTAYYNNTAYNLKLRNLNFVIFCHAQRSKRNKNIKIINDIQIKRRLIAKDL
jgi:hypothetical protein